jgi:hypothetical protein
MRPVWVDRKAQIIAGLAVVFTAAALVMRWPYSLADIDTIALMIVFPGALSFVLAFAPPPVTRANRIAKDLVCCWTALGAFAGSLLPLMIATVPVWLAVAVFAAKVDALRGLWGDDP